MPPLPLDEAPTPEAVIRLRAVEKTYRLGESEVRALDGITMDIPRGCFLAVMGSSGSGKSTLMNLLGCLDQPTAGRYELEGRLVAGLEDNELSDIRLRHIGFVFQSFNLLPQLTVRENIELPMYYLGHDGAASSARARELAGLVGLSGRLDHRPTQLSGGQRQRVAIARALANDPAIILADEPTGNLDSATGRQIMELLSRCHKTGKTIIMVTHEPRIAAYAQVRLHMCDGRVDRIEGGS